MVADAKYINPIKLRPGDVVCTKNPMFLGRLINTVQKFYSKDNKSKTSHTLIIKNVGGDTFESLWTVKSQNLYIDYHNKDVVVFRHRDMSFANFLKGIEAVSIHKGQIYPVWRLLFHLYPPLAKYISFGRLVCSELVGKFLFYSGHRDFKQYIGLTPDDIEDRLRLRRGWSIVYKGKI